MWASTTAAPATVDAGGAAASWHRIWALLLASELVALYAPTVAWLFDRWTLSVWSNAHGLLIPPVVAYVAHKELKRFAGMPPGASSWGFAFVIPALVLHVLDAGMHTQLLSAAALMLAIVGIVLLLLGVERTRAIAFPLALLAFSLPIPLAFTEPIHWQLRQVTTAGVTAVVAGLGIPVFVEGTTLHLVPGPLQVGDACSGFSTLYATAAVACLTAYMTRSTKRRLLVLLIAAPLAVGVNLLRVIGLVILVLWQGTGILNTVVHPLSGLMTFALALPVIFWLGSDSSEDPRP
jgi:exosortase